MSVGHPRHLQVLPELGSGSVLYTLLPYLVPRAKGMAGDMMLVKQIIGVSHSLSFDRKFNRNASITVKSVTTPDDVWRF